MQARAPWNVVTPDEVDTRHRLLALDEARGILAHIACPPDAYPAPRALVPPDIQERPT